MFYRVIINWLGSNLLKNIPMLTIMSQNSIIKRGKMLKTVQYSKMIER
jgi:hypothetical protein